MKISKEEFILEEKRLDKVNQIIKHKISSLGSDVLKSEEKALEFKKFIWDTHSSIDSAELKSLTTESDLEISLLNQKATYLQKLFRVQNKPYFGSIKYKEENSPKEEDIYIGISHVEENLNYYVHDWRSPICNLYYDYETGPCQYKSPSGIIKGNILRKRQYIIEDAKLINIFDNEINIDDELLQEVLLTESNDKMKNIVNTIQKEQNEVIRNTKDKNLIVEGIAGSGKTSVALHRIAFLLYKIPNLTSNDILIFSPNNIFTEYISNVLPELGENNTKETTISSFFENYLPMFKQVETFTNFIERYYQEEYINYDLISYKLGNNIIEDMTNYIKDITTNIKFNIDIINHDYCMTIEELNELLIKYNKFNIFRRIEIIAEKICDWYYQGKHAKKKTIIKDLYNSLSLKKDYINIYNNFFNNKYSKIKSNKEIYNKKIINYEDAPLFIYMISLLEEIDYNTNIKEIVIDEAQDYTKLEYILLRKIFKNANFTILGDTNQTINPYYKYNSLKDIIDIYERSRYLPLLKTYRSSPEIIEYTNKILNLNFISAIRNTNNKKVITRKEKTIKEQLLEDIKELKKFSKSIAIITKTNKETENIYNLLKDNINIIKIDKNSTNYNRELVIIPSYISKGLEFDSVIVYTSIDNKYTSKDKYLFYVACTRCQQQLIVYNQEENSI